MNSYKVIWEIELDAHNPVHAAELARDWQLDKDSTATVFTVQRLQKNGKPYKNATLSFDLSKMTARQITKKKGT